MNILYLASTRIPTEKASGLAIMRQCEAFANLGHTVTLLRPSRKDCIIEDAFSYYGIPVVFSIVSFSVFPLFLWLGMLGYILMRMTLLWQVTWFVWSNRKEIDVLYARDPWLLFIPLLFFQKEKMISEMHTKHSNWVTRTVVLKAGKCVVISEGLRNFYSELTQRTDISVEPSGVDLEQFKNLPSVPQVRSELVLPQNVTIFGYIGKYTTMGEEKGVSLLIESFGTLYAESKNAHLLLVGIEENEYTHIRALCEQMNLPLEAYSLRVLDTKSFAHYLHACDVLLMNYPDTEHYRLYMSPTKLFAYMASGKIIVTSNLQTVREIVDETMVVFVRPGDATHLQSVLKNICNNLQKFQLMGIKGKAEVNRYSWNNRAKRLLDKKL